MKFKCICLIPFILIILSFSISVSGQGVLTSAKQENQPQPDTAIIQILPIPVSSITAASNESFTLINESGNLRLTEEEINDFSNQTDTLISEIDPFLGDSLLMSFEGFNIRELENTSSRANIYFEQLSQLEQRLVKRSKGSEEAVAKLTYADKRWKLTLEQSTEREIPDALQNRMVRIIHDIDSVKTILQADFETILLQQNRLSDKKNELELLQNRIKDQRLLLGGSLFSRNMPGFFEDLRNLKDSTLIQRHKIQIKKSVQTDLKVFKSNFLVPLMFVTFLSIVLLIFSLWYKKHFARLISVEKFELSDINLTLIYSPALSVLFITSLLIRFIFPDLPQVFRAINMVVLFIPMLVLLIRLFGNLVKPWLPLLVIINILTFFYQLTYYPNIILRIVLLLFSISGFALFLWMILKKPVYSRFKSKLTYNFLLTILVGFTVMLFSAIVGNLLGAFRMAEFFTLVPLQIAILAIAIQVTTKVADTLVFLLLASNSFQRANVIREEFQIIHKKTVLLINLFLWLFFITTTLKIFRIKESFFEWGREVLTEGWKVGALDITPWSILIFIFVIWLSIFISRIVSHVLEKDVFVRVSTSKGMPTTIIMLLRIALITGGFFLAAAAAGMKLTNLSIIIGAFSVGIGFGLQNIFNNMVSGLILAFERPIKVGDTIQITDLMGVVLSIGFRASTIRTFDGSEVIVPNGNLISNQMINWTLSDSFRRMDIRVGVAYGTDPEVVIELLKEVASEHEKVLKFPPPAAFFLGFGDSSLDFRLLAWTDIEYRLSVESELYLSINKKLSEAGIEIPFPQTDLHIRSDFRNKKGDA